MPGSQRVRANFGGRGGVWLLGIGSWRVAGVVVVVAGWGLVLVGGMHGLAGYMFGQFGLAGRMRGLAR